jgi:hypothetical protein
MTQHDSSRVRGVVLILTVSLIAASGASSQLVPPVHALGAVIATSPIAFSTVGQLVPLSNGRVFVSDPAKHKLYLLGPSLTSLKTVFDSAPGQPNSYPAGTVLLPFRGDSALLYDGAAKALVVLDPSGITGRVMALPTGLTSMSTSTQFGPAPATSPEALIFSQRTSSPGRAAPPGGVPEGSPDIRSTTFDTALVIRMNFATRTIDTVSRVGTGAFTISTVGYRQSGSRYVTPLFPFIDDAIVTSDGSIAIYHAHEFRVEWIHPDGTRSSAKTAYDWRRLPETLRDHLVDSANARRRAVYDSILHQRAVDSAAGTLRMTTSVSVDGEPGRPRLIAPPLAPQYMTADEFFDFYPPTGRAAVRADADNHIWINPIAATPDPAGAVWEVVDPLGTVTDRVLIPSGTSIVGFGAKGLIYVAHKDAGAMILQVMRWR